MKERVSRKALVGAIAGISLVVVLSPLEGPIALAGAFCAGDTDRTSVNGTSQQANGPSSDASISATGRLVVYVSAATNLVPGDTNDFADVFVQDQIDLTVERVSVASDGTEANGPSSQPVISNNDRFVVFVSTATNLVPGDVNGRADVFVRDRDTETTELVSVSSAGAQGNASSLHPALDRGGDLVAFDSASSTLVPGDTNGKSDVFVRALPAGTTERVSVNGNGGQANGPSTRPSLSKPPSSGGPDGKIVAFQSNATNLVPNDTNSVSDVFVHNRLTGATERVSVDGSGGQANDGSRSASVSGTGAQVAFASSASNLVADDTNGVEDIFLRIRLFGTTERMSVNALGQQANSRSFDPVLAGMGGEVVFVSLATNLVTGDTNGVADVFRHVPDNGVTARVSVDSSGVQANGPSAEPSISQGGHYFLFSSLATNLVTSDTNGVQDTFLHCK